MKRWLSHDTLRHCVRNFGIDLSISLPLTLLQSIQPHPRIHQVCLVFTISRPRVGSGLPSFSSRTNVTASHPHCHCTSRLLPAIPAPTFSKAIVRGTDREQRLLVSYSFTPPPPRSEMQAPGSAISLHEKACFFEIYHSFDACYSQPYRPSEPSSLR